MWSALLGPIVGGLFGVIDKAVEDKDEAARIKARLQEMVLTGQMKEIEAAAAVIVAEAQGGSWLQRSWRPLTMLIFVGLIVARWFGLTVPNLTPEVEIKVFEIIQLGIGGYVIGRSVEKGVQVWKRRPD
jgi:pyridoxine 5'-phosphate synthase PdxJ